MCNETYPIFSYRAGRTRQQKQKIEPKSCTQNWWNLAEHWYSLNLPWQRENKVSHSMGNNSHEYKRICHCSRKRKKNAFGNLLVLLLCSWHHRMICLLRVRGGIKSKHLLNLKRQVLGIVILKWHWAKKKYKSFPCRIIYVNFSYILFNYCRKWRQYGKIQKSAFTEPVYEYFIAGERYLNIVSVTKNSTANYDEISDSQFCDDDEVCSVWL